MMIHCSAGLSAVNAEERSSAILPPTRPGHTDIFRARGLVLQGARLRRSRGAFGEVRARCRGGNEAARRARSVMGGDSRRRAGVKRQIPSAPSASEAPERTRAKQQPKARKRPASMCPTVRQPGEVQPECPQTICPPQKTHLHKREVFPGSEDPGKPNYPMNRTFREAREPLHVRFLGRAHSSSRCRPRQEKAPKKAPRFSKNFVLGAGKAGRADRSAQIWVASVEQLSRLSGAKGNAALAGTSLIISRRAGRRRRALLAVLRELQQLAAAQRAELRAEAPRQTPRQAIDALLALHTALRIAAAMPRHHAQRREGTTGAAHAPETGPEGRAEAQRLRPAHPQRLGKGRQHRLSAAVSLVKGIESILRGRVHDRNIR